MTISQITSKTLQGTERGFTPLPANVENMVSSENANKGEIIFNLAFKGLNYEATFFILKQVLNSPERNCTSYMIFVTQFIWYWYVDSFVTSTLISNFINFV